MLNGGFVRSVNADFVLKIATEQHGDFIAQIGGLDGGDTVPALTVTKTTGNSVDVRVEFKCEDEPISFEIECERIDGEETPKVFEFKQRAFSIKGLNFEAEYALRVKCKLSDSVWSLCSLARTVKIGKKKLEVVLKPGNNSEIATIESEQPGEFTFSFKDKNGLFFADAALDPTKRYKWEVICAHWEGNPTERPVGIDALDNTTYPGRSKQNSWGVYYFDVNNLDFWALNKRGKDHNNSGKYARTGCRFECDFNGPRSEFAISFDGKLMYTFTGVKGSKPLYPSFYVKDSKNKWTVKNFRVVG